MSDNATLYHRLLVRRVLASNDAALLQVTFDLAVVQKYRDEPAVTLIRTNTAGRIKREGAWSIDVGIEGDTVHASLRALLVLPEAERQHWAQYAVALPMSQAFLQMQLQPGSCFDDGEVRAWD
jgi:hypothetical protein